MTSLKRCFDVVAASVLLVALSPLLLLVGIAVAYRLGRPILFRQTRGGLGGVEFTFLKFRSMISERMRDGQLLSDEERLTPFGRALRFVSLDELPQLWNVLKGDMSLVGPRPLLASYLPRYQPWQRRRHAVRPGITGWAQVHGRNALTWDSKFEYDLWYVDHATFWLDLQILAMTAAKLIRPHGINHDACATAPEFLGGQREC